MSSRITRENLYEQMRVLNKTCDLSGHPERYALQIWSPGDGWTRYQLITEDGAFDRSLVCNARGIYDVLYTLIRVLSTLPVE